MQPQGHLQVLNNMIDFGMDPQANPALAFPSYILCPLPPIIDAGSPLANFLRRMTAVDPQCMRPADDGVGATERCKSAMTRGRWWE